MNLGQYISFSQRVAQRQLRHRAEQEARDRQEQSDREIMGQLLAEQRQLASPAPRGPKSSSKKSSPELQRDAHVHVFHLERRIENLLGTFTKKNFRIARRSLMLTNKHVRRRGFLYEDEIFNTLVRDFRLISYAACLSSWPNSWRSRILEAFLLRLNAPQTPPVFQLIPEVSPIEWAQFAQEERKHV
jgi:hypothetical protein